MLKLNKSLIIQQIEQVLLHLETHAALSNIHMVDYFTNNVFSEHIPKDVRQEAIKNGYQQTIEAIYTQNTEHLTFLHQYIKKSQELTLKNTSVCLSLDQLKDKLQQLGYKETNYLKLNIFMKAKKSHEVEILSELAAALKDVTATSHLIDIGDGKGYLSSMLALHYKVPVLGIDASELNTNSAVDRAKKLSKVWNGVVTNIKSRETSIDLYKQITKFVDETINFQELVANIFLEKSNRIGLVGLHTCGNLASTCLKIYNEAEEIKMICNVGCCYHHLTEEFVKNEEVEVLETGFPLSCFLKNKKCAINRGARMIAAQSIDRILDTKERPSKTVFYRALFEVIIEQRAKDIDKASRQVGRFKKASPNFLDYVRKASKRIKLPLEISDEDINLIFSQYEHRMDEMDLFYLIRAMLAPVIESLILLDRLLFLYENGYENSFLVKLFDPVVSPRCYGIISIKS